jgi:hypothetical protein
MMHGAARILRGLAVLWELPLGAGSLLFQRAIRWVVVRIGLRHYRSHPDEFRRWRVLGRDYLDAPQGLARYMLIGPRWNVHAVVASAGPLRVERSVSLDRAALADSAEYWAVGAKHFPSFREEAQYSSLTHPDSNSRLEFELPPGDYYITSRYYIWSDRPVLPPVLVDGREMVPATEFAPDVNEFYDDLQNRGRLFYRCVHYYVYALLKWRGLLSGAWVHRELLPVGNVETEFHYGVVRRGQRLRVRVDPGVFVAHRVYCAIYDQASLPIHWFEITEAEQTGPPSQRNGVYLVRVVQIQPASSSERGLPLTVEVCAAVALADASVPRPREA